MSVTYAYPEHIDVISIERGSEKIASIRDWGYNPWDTNKYSSALRKVGGREENEFGDTAKSIAEWLGKKFPELRGAFVFVKRIGSSGFGNPAQI